MATAPTVSIQWIPEDDVLLKNAVEAGASLEALAKGAVLFSRRYTLRELQERWHSLLYDPDVSAQAAAQIFELEISDTNPASKFNRSENFIGSKEVSHKRKSASIRGKYYAMRKKFRSELFSNRDLGLFESNPLEFGEQSAEFQKQVMQDGNPLGRSMIGECMSDRLGLREEDLDIFQDAFMGTMRDNVGVSGANNALGGYGLDENVTSSINENPHTSSVGLEGRQQIEQSNCDGFSSLQTIVLAPDQPHLRQWRTMEDVAASSVPTTEDTTDNDVGGKENSSTACMGEFADPDSLLNFSNEDEMLDDVDEKYAAEKCCIDNTGPIVQDSIKDDHENDTAKKELEPVTVAEVIRATVPSAEPVSTTSVHGNEQMDSQSVVDASSNSTSISGFTGLGEGKTCCVLNTEDAEIPCNDDIFLLIHPSMSYGSSPTQPDTTRPMTSAAHEIDYEHPLNFTAKANDSGKAFPWPHMEGIHSFPKSHRKAKAEIHDSRPQALTPGFVTKTIRDSIEGGSQYAISKQCGNSLAKKEVAGADIKLGQNTMTVTDIIRSTEAGSARSQHAESVVEDSVSDEESEIDDDLPYFSDIEAMILEMDLDPYDQDSNNFRQVPSYQYDDTKRTIIRLEQGARSCLQRAMTSQEALAILYGRHLRHYIRKPVVLLGRSTDDNDVDIDLTKEGRANKISRRQAIIKMEEDGSFSLKNLGRSSVSVNGVAVASGQLLNLSTNCLIEIKGMSFVFEINQGYVRKQLGRFCMKNKGKM